MPRRWARPSVAHTQQKRSVGGKWCSDKVARRRGWARARRGTHLCSMVDGAMVRCLSARRAHTRATLARCAAVAPRRGGSGSAPPWPRPCESKSARAPTAQR
eukprot:2349345-Prymnesium_polylepis.2